MVNRNFSSLEANAPALPDYPIAYDANKALNAAAATKTNTDFAVQWAGQGAPLAREMPAAALVRLLALELK
jgi:nitronate monooxygenase